jgi:RNA recognition motif-containing protein
MADRKLFIGNLVRRITQDDLWVMYSKFGPLEECAKFHESFGFVRFLHAEDARQALDATHGITIKGRCIKVEFAATTTSWRSANSSYCNECRSSGNTISFEPCFISMDF